ncbi:serine-rich adhesin for platelets-like isoform X2 [Periplaneta americana]|uniref:serine-rich adhesin for platelets-like isoform X2 n=1 Tax=Periplaneta americana TaxID=6978 RepID=UPI0037E76B76
MTACRLQHRQTVQRRRVALDAVLKKRQQILARRRRSLQRRVWRRYLREPFWDLRTRLFVSTAAGGPGTSGPSLDEVLSTIRKAWEPPRCLSADRDTGAVLEEEEMGTGRGISRKTQGDQVPSNPGLPHRRYSVPETVMRKYSLNKQRSSSSDSGVATVPVATPDSISSNPPVQPSTSSSEETYSDSSSSDTSMGNKGTRVTPLHTNAPTRSTLDTVTEEVSDSVPGKRSSDTLEPVSSIKEDASSISPEKEITNSTETQSQSVELNVKQNQPKTPDTSELENSVKSDLPSSQTLNVSSAQSSSASIAKKEKKLSLQNTSTSTEPPKSVNESLSLHKITENKCATGSGKEKRKISLNSTSTEPKSSAKDDLSSSQTFSIQSIESTQNKDIIHSPQDVAVSTEPQSSAKDDLSSSQTLEIESTDSRTLSLPEPDAGLNSHSNTESGEQASLGNNHISSSQTMDVEPTEGENSSSLYKGMNKHKPKSTESIEPKSSNNEEFTTQSESIQSVSVSQSSSNKESRQSSGGSSKSAKERSTSRRDQSVHSDRERQSSTMNKSRDTEDTLEPRSSSRDELSSSQTMEVPSTDSRPSTNQNRTSAASEITESPDRRQRTPSSTPGGEVSFTPTECCVSTPDPERSQSLSSDRASESCSITPVGQTSESSMSASSPERPSIDPRSPVSSISPQSSDHTYSTQDATLSVRSDPIILGRPASVIRGNMTGTMQHSKYTQVSDSEQSIGHIEFMNENIDNESRPMLHMLSRNFSSNGVKDDTDSAKLAKSQSTESSSEQQTGDSGHATEPDSRLVEDFCGTSNLLENNNQVKKSDEVEILTEAVRGPNKQASTNTEPVLCRHQSRAWEIIIQPTMVQNSSKCPSDGFCGTKTKSPHNKLSILPSKNQDVDFFSTKTYLVIRPSGSTTMQASTSFCGTQTYPLAKSNSSSVVKTQPVSREVEIFDPKILNPTKSEDSAPYSWSRLTDEERTVRVQHQRHRLWMNRRLSAANALPPSPMHGPLSSITGTGSTYRKNYDVQLVVPRYSALPRSVSMLVNTSSGECSSNSNSDSECLSLVDSLEDRPSSCTNKHKPNKHDSKPVRGDIVRLLPEESISKYDLHRRINAATPRGKGKAFFVSMASGIDEAGKIEVEEDVDKQAVSQSMPDRLKKKLSQRHQQMELKKNKKKRLKNKDISLETASNAQMETVPLNVHTSIHSVQVPNNIQNSDVPDDTINMSGVPQVETASEEVFTVVDQTSSAKSLPVNSEKDENKIHRLRRVKSLTSALFHPISESNTGGTFIVSRNDDQERKPIEQSVPLEISTNMGDMIQKEQIPEERSPPVKRFKASRRKTSSQKDKDSSKKDFSVKSEHPSENGEVINKEPTTEQIISMHSMATPHLSNNSDVVEERSTFKQDTKLRTSDAKENENKEHRVQKRKPKTLPEMKIAQNEEIKPSEEFEVQDKKTLVLSKEKPEGQEISLETKNFTKNKKQRERKLPKDTETKCETSVKRDLITEDQSLPQSATCDSKISNAEKLAAIGKGTIKDSPSPEVNESVPKTIEKREAKKPKVPEENKNKPNKSIEKKLKIDQISENAKHVIRSSPDVVQMQKTEHGHNRKADLTKANKEIDQRIKETVPEEKILSTASCQTSPQLKSDEDKSLSSPNLSLQTDKSDLSPDSIRNMIKSQLPVKSSIPIMKSPVGARKLSPDTAITMQKTQRNSHLPVRRTSRLLYAPPVRRSANLLGARFHQKFEVIPEERSASLESSTEDQARLVNDRRPSLPIGAGGVSRKIGVANVLGDRCNIVPHSCIGINQPNNINMTYTKYRQTLLHNPHKYNIDSNNSSQDENSNLSANINSTSNDATRPVIRRPTCQSRIPRAEKITRQNRIPEETMSEEHEDKKTTHNYQGKAALAPHTEDKDLLTLSKGWLNFYLLKDGRSTPDSSCGEVTTDVSDIEGRLPRRRCTALQKTVTVVGGDDNRIRQYTIQSRPSPEESSKGKETPTILPDLNSNSSTRRHSLVSVEKLPTTVVEPSDSAADSDQSTTYLCLPSSRLRAADLMEGSGELACSESSSVSSSSDSEPDRATSPAMLPVRWPIRQPRRVPLHNRSRSRTKHHKPETFYQGGGSGSAGWTVTVAGSNACPQQPPELEMRLSFPSCPRRPAASQSDSGLGEDNNGEKSKKQLQDGEPQEDNEDLQHFLPTTQQSAPQTHRWTLMLKNQGGCEITKSGKRTYQCLPDLGYIPGQNKNSKKALKRPETSVPVTSIIDEDTRKSKKFSLIWPKVHKIIESKVIIRKSSGQISQEVKSVSQLLENEDGAVVLRSGLAVKGSAITPEKKPRVPTMSERDLTRSHTAKH